MWLTSTQVSILPISEKYQAYAENVSKVLNNCDIRALIDDRNEKTGRKIRDAEVQKIPFMLIVGEKEEAEGTVSVRKHGGEDLGAMSIDAFSTLVQEAVEAELSTEV